MKGKKLSLKEKLTKLEDDKKERQRICKAFCQHLEEGLSRACFAEVHIQTLERYMKAYPEDFPQEEIDLAASKGQQTWERIGKKQSTGECMGNSRSWYYNMANRYGWREKIELEAEHKGQVNVNIVSYASRKDSSDTPE